MATFDEVKRAASGRWSGIITQLCGPVLSEALQKYGDPVDCPVCGGKKKFRVFDNPNRGFEQTGGCICNHCGPRFDGLRTISWLQGDSDSGQDINARNQVADLLRLSDVQPLQYKRSPSSRQSYSRGSSSQPQPASPPEAVSTQSATAVETPKPVYRAAPNAKSMWAAWKHTVDVMHPSAAPMRRYLVGRKLPMSKDLPHELVLRFHPNLDYYQKDENTGDLIHHGSHPAMMALLLRPDGTPACLHRTYLTPAGLKADLPNPKKLWNCFTDEPLAGSAIRLYPSGKILGITEGIETALSVRLATRMPVWAIYTCEIMPYVYIPPHVEHVVIWADKDKSMAGQKKALELQTRLREEGRVRCDIALPEVPIPRGTKGVDWADLWVKHGAAKFPFRSFAEDSESSSTNVEGAHHANGSV